MPQDNFRYDTTTLARIINFFKLTLLIIDERREKSNRPVEYRDPGCEYIYIQEAVEMIELHRNGRKLITDENNKQLIDVFELAGRIFHSRIMSLHNYHVETKRMIDARNGIETDYPTNLTLRLGAINRRAA